MGNRASEYPWSNSFPGGKISARVKCRRASCCEVLHIPCSCGMLSATEANYLSRRQGVDEVGRVRWVCGPAARLCTLPPAL